MGREVGTAEGLWWLKWAGGFEGWSGGDREDGGVG